MRILLISAILVGLIVFTVVQVKQLVLIIKERKRSKTAVAQSSDAQEKDKISK